MRPFLGGVALVLTLSLAACGDVPASEVVASSAPSVDPPPVGARLHEGGWAELAALIRVHNEAGRPVVVNLFASWCEPCKEEAPLLRQTAADNPDVAFVGIDHVDLLERGQQFLDDHPLGFTTLWDVQGDVAATIGARGMPTTAFFDVEGRLVELHTGIIDQPTLDAGIAKIRSDP